MSSLGTFSAALRGLARYKQSLNSSTTGGWLRSSHRSSDSPSWTQQWDPGGCTGPLSQSPLVQFSTAIPKASPHIAEGTGWLCLMVMSTQEPTMGRENQMVPAAPRSGL